MSEHQLKLQYIFTTFDEGWSGHIRSKRHCLENENGVYQKSGEKNDWDITLQQKTNLNYIIYLDCIQVFVPGIYIVINFGIN